MAKKIDKDKIINKDLRRRIITEGTKRKHGHYGSSMSCVDTVAYLYRKVMKENDIFIMSKGHGAPALHVVLEEKGIIPPWTIHIEYAENQGIKATGGSLGHGLSIALGRAYAKKYLKKDGGKVYCMLGDGELQEGMIWESFNIAKKFKIDNLIPLVDWNKYQAIDSLEEVMEEDYGTIKNKLNAFGYNVTKVNGHNNRSLSKLNRLEKGLNAVVLDTIKGLGVPVLHRNPTFHVYYFHEHPEEMKEALDYLK
ncbi:MAG: 1-deoxy-D-xylulose-5-phosphate synthase N-terminal domain-containing protein [Promethearchaeota archaeon]